MQSEGHIIDELNTAVLGLAVEIVKDLRHMSAQRNRVVIDG